MSVNTRQSYCQIGSGLNPDNTLVNVLDLPAPKSLPSSDNFMVTANRNTRGQLILQYVGRTQYKTNITWGKLNNKKWWEINRWFKDYGYDFYFKYFSHTDGRIKIHKFYRGDLSEPTVSSDTEVLDGIVVPKFYIDAGFSVIDMGLDDVRIVKSINIGR